MSRRPNTKTIQKVIDWLAENGFNVYGCDEDGAGFNDYDSAEEILRIIKAIENETCHNATKSVLSQSESRQDTAIEKTRES